MLSGSGSTLAPTWLASFITKSCYIVLHRLVGGIPTPLKNMTSSVRIMTFPTEWEVIKVMFQTTNQHHLTSAHPSFKPHKRPKWLPPVSKTPVSINRLQRQSSILRIVTLPKKIAPVEFTTISARDFTDWKKTNRWVEEQIPARQARSKMESVTALIATSCAMHYGSTTVGLTNVTKRYRGNFFFNGDLRGFSRT